jgi:hypothetical protein
MCLDGDWIDTECEELERGGTCTDANFTRAREGWLTASKGVSAVTHSSAFGDRL